MANFYALSRSIRKKQQGTSKNQGLGSTGKINKMAQHLTQRAQTEFREREVLYPGTSRVDGSSSNQSNETQVKLNQLQNKNAKNRQEAHSKLQF